MEINSLKFEGVTHSPGGGEIVFSNLDFEFPMNEIIWVKGYEGAGKSTLLNLLSALEAPQHGRYLINDIDTSDMSFEEFLPYRLKIGYTFDYGGLINNKTILENLAFPLLYHKLMPSHKIRETVEYLADYFDFKKFANERPAHVPGRLRKLICLLRPMLMRPDLLIMDDPSVGVGTDSAYLLSDYISELRLEGSLKHIFIASYDERFMDMFNHNILHLGEGQLHYQKREVEKKAANL